MSSAAALAQKRCPQCGATYGEDAVFCAKDGARLPYDDAEDAALRDPYIGTLISDDIELRSVIGVGAMGRVYRAHQRGIDRDVAVKILHRELSGNAQLVQRFNREAKIASKLQHPHVVEVYLAGQLPDRAMYMVMEYLDGMSLAAALVEAGGALAPARALSIALQLCDAVGEGHVRGIIHRDLKPENVMLVRRAEIGDWVKVLDFGIAKAAVGEQSMQTVAGLVFGTARYISPEGAQGTNVTPAGDVYSLATIVFQMLAGRTPFDAEPLGLLIKHIHEEPPPITSFAPAAGLHPALAKVVMDNLAKDPANRAQNGRAFAAQLASAAREASISISQVGVIARLGNADASRSSSALEPTLDDAAGVLADRRGSVPIIATPSSPKTLAMVPAPAPPEPSLAPPPASAPTSDREPPPRSSAIPRIEPRRPSIAFLVLALLLGATLAVLGVQYFGRRADAVHEAHVARTRAALADSRYIRPPDDCVRDLVVAGLKKWPNDVDLLQLRSTASMELVTRAMVAQNGGDVGGARDLAKEATELDPTDHTAALLLSQYDEEVKALGTDASTATGRPRVLFEAIPIAHAGAHVDLSARVTAGAAHGKVADARMTLFEHSKTPVGKPIPVTFAGNGLYRAAMTAPEPGNYDVVFEASVEGPNLRAVRELTVLP